MDRALVMSCPSCGSEKLFKDGFRYNSEGHVQRYLCRNCSRRFSEHMKSSIPQFKIKKDIISQPAKTFDSRPDFTDISVSQCNSAGKKALNNPFFPFRKDVASHIDSSESTIGKTINSFASTIGNAKVRVSEVEMKNLVKVETRNEKRAAGATRQTEADEKGKVVEFLWHLKKQGRSESTIRCYGRRLDQLVRAGLNLTKPEEVKEFLAKQEKWSNSTKAIDVATYSSFLKFLNVSWNPPRYRPEAKIPFIPTEQEIDQLIAAAGKKLAVFLQLLKETGMRRGEAARVRWIDIDFQQRTVRVTPLKGSNPRILPISEKLIHMLKGIPKKSDRVFPATLSSTTSNLHQQRKKIARKLGTPRLLEITFHTFRHWKGTTEYHKTKDPYHVMQILGHKRMDSTLLYINIEQAVYHNALPDQFHVRVAETQEEIEEFLEAGFEYVLQKERLAYFRKRK